MEERPPITSARKTADSGAEVRCDAIKESSVIVTHGSGARRRRLAISLRIARESDPGKLPAFFRLKAIAVGRPDVTARGGAGTAAQNVLIAHELAVVFAQRAWGCAIAGIWRIGAARPFPDIAKHLVKMSIVFGSE